MTKDRKTLFVEVILPLPLPKLYTYRIPFELNDDVEAGKRVVVQFGKRKMYTAIIENIHQKAPKDYEAKYIFSILDAEPVICLKQLEHWKWLASYYMCTLGEVMNAAIPSGLKLESETKLMLNRSFSGDYSILSDKEYMVKDALELRDVLTVNEVTKVLSQKTVFPMIKSLIDKGVVLVEEELISYYKPKMETYIRLTSEGFSRVGSPSPPVGGRVGVGLQIDGEDGLKKTFEQLEKVPKQLELLMSYMNLYSARQPVEITRTELLKSAGTSSNTLNQLIKKGIFEAYEVEVGRLKGELPWYQGQETEPLKLSKSQQTALNQIKEIFGKKDVILLHGVTSSGKTEIYIQLIEETIQQGKQVLYLLPEIALTTQIINRLRKHFGNRVGVYHSKFNNRERVEIWNSVLENSKILYPESRKNKPETNSKGIVRKDSFGDTYNIILGARSAMFLPFDNLGLVIVDEEHENTYKQIDPAPRYNARDSALYLSRLHGAKTLLGSATPSIESYHNAKSGKYGLVELMERYGKVQMPEIMLVNIKEESRRKRMKSHFSPLLMDLVQQSLASSEQVILFQNRRGFSPFLECSTCAWIPHCIHCDVTLTYHKLFNRLRCHYCGYGQKLPKNCAACGAPNMQTKGFGTEKIEEELAIYFPKARTVRMDLDTTRSKHAHQNIINDFENRKLDILVGTQMITKGLDFNNVSVVGILNADNMLNFPDFRAFERSYQLMAQVSGRAGRTKKGRVVIQSYDPTHSVIKNVVNNDYHRLYEEEMVQRKKFRYPPFYRLIQITVKHTDYKMTDIAADYLAANMKKKFGRRVLGPEYPLVGRVRNLYLKKILLKLEKEASANKAKFTLQEIVNDFRTKAAYKTVKVQVDVDPM